MKKVGKHVIQRTNVQVSWNLNSCRRDTKPQTKNKRHCTVMPTQVSDDLLDHVFEHASAVLWMKEGEKLLLVQQLVSWRVIRLEPAILQTFQYLLSCGNTTHQPTLIKLHKCHKWNLQNYLLENSCFNMASILDSITTHLSSKLRNSSIKKSEDRQSHHL